MASVAELQDLHVAAAQMRAGPLVMLAVHSGSG
jgi:hypothetical protein